MSPCPICNMKALGKNAFEVLSSLDNLCTSNCHPCGLSQTSVSESQEVTFLGRGLGAVSVCGLWECGASRVRTWEKVWMRTRGP